MYLQSPGNQYVFCMLNKLFLTVSCQSVFPRKVLTLAALLKLFPLLFFISLFVENSVQSQWLSFLTFLLIVVCLWFYATWLETGPIILLFGFYWSVTSLRSKLRLIQIKLELAASSYLARLKRTTSNVLIDDSTRIFYCWA